ncbi:MAG: tyrosine-type recombinase/integrase [Hyphomonas sp.]|uniref:tyrosine-type recombinase/integrase n=1 Tax=Hyphomonas sp. TaxID=87 RepID=UPI003267E854
MPYYIEKRDNGFYRLRGTHHGIPAKDRSLKTRSREQAEALREAAERTVFEQVILGKRPAQTFAELAVDYLKAGRDLGPKAEDIIADLAEKHLDDITPADCDRLAARIYPTAKPSTVNRNIISPISAIMCWAAADNRVQLRKWPRRRERQTRTDWRRPDQIEAILTAISSPQGRAIAALYVGCGLRASEAVFADGRDFAPDLSQVTIQGTAWDDDGAAADKGYEGTKGFYSRTVKIPPRAREFLMPVISLEPGRALVNSRGYPWSDRNGPRKMLETACAACKVPPLTPHVLRHTWATWHYAVHKDRLKLLSEGGWTDDDLIKRYVHLADDALAGEVIARNWAISGQRASPESENINGNKAQSA